MKQLPNEKRQTEIIKEIEIAEQKARNMVEFAKKIATKWKIRLSQTQQDKQIHE